jgi:hypothetical protein
MMPWQVIRLSQTHASDSDLSLAGTDKPTLQVPAVITHFSDKLLEMTGPICDIHSGFIQSSKGEIQ